MKPAFYFVLLLTTFTLVAQEQSVNNNSGLWIDNSTWTDSSSPGYSNVPSFTIFGYVTSESSVSMVNSASQSIDIQDTLVVQGDISFASNKNFAAVTVGSGGVLIIFGNLSMGKNNAGITVEAGGVLVVTEDVVDNGGGGNTIDAEGDLYVGGDSGDVGGTGVVKPIDELSDDGFSEIEDFVSGGGSTPLPVELLFFDLELSNHVILTWATSTEINNSYFVIERSEDGMHFYEIGRVDGHGNTSEEIHYTYEDKFILSSKEYYRLKQVDFDGRFEYFEVKMIATNLDSQEKLSVKAYPTIIQNQITHIVSSKPILIIDAEAYSLEGKQSRNLKGSLIRKDPLNYDIDLSTLSKGVYMLEVRTSEGNLIRSKVVLR